jgi:site-specific recombinase XerD
VVALLNYISLRPQGHGPLLLHNDQSPLTRQEFIVELKSAIQLLGLNQQLYSGHSFRIGAATSAASAGVPAHIIQTMGRWSSDAYLCYIRSSADELAKVARSITLGSSC